MTRRDLLITKLLALAGNNPCRAEAASAFRMARKMAEDQNVLHRHPALNFKIRHEVGPVVNGVRYWTLSCDAQGDWSLWMHNLAFPEQVWPAICDTERDCRVRHDLTMQPGEVLPVRLVLLRDGQVIHEEMLEVRG